MLPTEAVSVEAALTVIYSDVAYLKRLTGCRKCRETDNIAKVNRHRFVRFRYHRLTLN